MAKKSAYQKQLEEANKQIKALGNYSYSDKNGLKKAYDAAYKTYSDMLSNPEKFGYNRYLNDVNTLFNNVMNQKQFSYDPQQDMLFQAYKRQYQNQGNRAMKNQMGTAAALSGGYNSSAAQTSTQNAYQNYMNALSEKAAETYQNSLDMYRYDRQNTIDKFNTALDMNSMGNDSYFRQTDANAQKMNNAYNAFNDDRSFGYNQYSDNRSYWQNQGKNALDQINWQKEYELQKKLYKGG